MHEPRENARASGFAARGKKRREWDQRGWDQRERETLDGKRRKLEAGSIGLEGPAYGKQDGEQTD
jgi:hypothetical protein